MVSNFTFKHFFSHIYHYKMAELYPNQVGGEGGKWPKANQND